MNQSNNRDLQILLKNLRDQAEVASAFGSISKQKLHIKNLFKKFDMSGNEQIEMNEFVKAMKAMNFLLTPQMTQDIFDYFDKDRSGYLDLNEFIDGIYSTSGGTKNNGAVMAQSDLAIRKVLAKLPPGDACKQELVRYGLGFEKVSKLVLQHAASLNPSRPPILARPWVQVGPPAPLTLKVMQFNLLAEGLSAPPGARPPFSAQEKSSYGGFDSVADPDRVFNFQSRKVRLLAEILAAQPDILTVQECDHFHDFFQPALAAAGYGSSFQPKDKAPTMQFGYYSDGVAIFWRKDKLVLRAQYANAFAVNPQGKDESVPTVVAHLMLQATGHDIVVGTTHLKSKPGEETEARRVSQVQCVLNSMNDMVKSSGAKHILFMGDFNTDPYNDPKHRAACVPAVLAWPVAKMSSAYPLPQSDRDPLYSTWKKRGDTESKHMIDYIWHSDGFRPVALHMPPADKDLDPARLPGMCYPSDHLAMTAVLALN